MGRGRPAVTAPEGKGKWGRDGFLQEPRLRIPGGGSGLLVLGPGRAVTGGGAVPRYGYLGTGCARAVAAQGGGGTGQREKRGGWRGG